MRPVRKAGWARAERCAPAAKSPFTEGRVSSKCPRHCQIRASECTIPVLLRIYVFPCHGINIRLRCEPAFFFDLSFGAPSAVPFSVRRAPRAARAAMAASPRSSFALKGRTYPTQKFFPPCLPAWPMPAGIQPSPGLLRPGHLASALALLSCPRLLELPRWGLPKPRGPFPQPRLHVFPHSKNGAQPACLSSQGLLRRL